MQKEKKEKREKRRRFRAIVEAEYALSEADAIAKALQADNVSNSETIVSTSSCKGRVLSRVESVSLEKLLPVLDDLLLCQSLAERTLKLAQRGRDRQ